MTNSNNGNSSDENNSKWSWGDIRKSFILVLIFGWLCGFFYKYETIDEKSFYVLFGLVVLYLLDLLFSIILSAKASEFFKSFMFQTAIPISALTIVGILAYNKSIDSSTTLSLFGLSLGYTTYVVGKRLRKEDDKDK